VDGDGRLTYLNPAGEALLGLDADRWLGSPVVASLDEIAPGMGGLLRRSLEDRTPVRRYKTRGRRNGKAITLGVSTAVPRRDEAAPPSATAIFQDITESERVEALNRRTERLEAVAELSASLAHEIKNPLASIRSAVQQIARPGLDAADRRTLERLVLTESDRLSRLLSRFLEFSGLRMGRSEPLDLSELVDDCVALVRQHPECGDGVRVRREGADGAVPVPGDADLLHRAVFNLLLNATQFSAPEGRVTVRLERRPEPLPREAQEIPSAVRLSVRDTGPGVPPDRVDRIFDPFYTTRPGGSGLGLSVVHRAVEVHDGVVLVDRPPEGGAEFVVYLPGSPEAAEEAP
jgi:PAS domain S-box-containing protein